MKLVRNLINYSIFYNSNDIIPVLISLPKRVWVNATHEQSVLSNAFPIVKAPTASMGIPTNIMKRSLTIKLIRIMLNFVLWACVKYKNVVLIFKNTVSKYSFEVHYKILDIFTWHALSNAITLRKPPVTPTSIK